MKKLLEIISEKITLEMLIIDGGLSYTSFSFSLDYQLSIKRKLHIYPAIAKAI